MAASLKNIGAGTQGQAAEALTALAGTGQVGAANLQKFAATAIAVERTIGTSVTDTAKAFADLAKDPLKATEKLAKGTGYLTLALYDQIKALEDQGKKTEAAAMAQSAYDTAQAATAEKLKGNLGSLEKLMNGVTGTSMRLGYQNAPATHAGWTGEREVPDFRPHTLAMLSEGPALLLKAEAAEYKYGAFSESTDTFSVKTYVSVRSTPH